MANVQMEKVVKRWGNNRIVFFSKVNPYTHRQFMSILDYILQDNEKVITLDFSKIRRAYPDGMIPIITTVDYLKRMGVKVHVSLPTHSDTRRLFLHTNWAYLLSPEHFHLEITQHNKHLVAKRFNSSEEQQSVVNEFVDIVMRNMEVKREVIAGLEWSINEITDNVLNHSESPDGGIIQVSTYPKNHSVSFAVSDSGVGILQTLSQGIPTLRTDIEALGEAVKAGVTRGKEYGQGNGLAGTLRIATMSQGSFSVTSGKGHMEVVSVRDARRFTRRDFEVFNGTIVCASIRTDIDFSLGEALGFNDDKEHNPIDYIEVNYENDSNVMKLVASQESTGFGNRGAGRQLRVKSLNLLNANPSCPLEIDWSGVPLISSSFADEFIGKIFLELGAMSFAARIRNVGMESLIRKLLDKAVLQRLVQASDDE